jgi:hypothetical protein
MFRVQMRRGRDHHRVNRRILQQMPIVGVDRGTGGQAPRAVELFRENVAKGNRFRVGTGSHVVQKVRRAVAETDESDPDPVMGAPHPRRHGCQRPESGRDFAEKVPAGIHIRSVANRL